MAVRRGEAYYDDNGSIVYGQPPVKPKQDENGNYYIQDEDGSVIYTDEHGEPLPDHSGEPAIDGAGEPVTLPQTPADGDPSSSQTEPGGQENPDGQAGNQTTPGDQTDPGNQTQPGTDPDTSLPAEPAGPNVPDESQDEPALPEEEVMDMPDWLRPQE